MEPRTLVCERCWRDFFNTDAFEKCCTGSDDRSLIDAVTTVDNTRNAASSGCAWCKFIKSLIRDSQIGENIVSVRFSRSIIESCTPKGCNTYYLSASCESPTGRWESGAALLLHAFTNAEDKASSYVTARPLRTDVNSNTATHQIKTWLKECELHESCPSLHKDSMLPTRLIEVNPQGQQEPRLSETEGTHGIYATLSYCWGAAPFQTLNKSNYAQFTKGLDMNTLPPIFRDAITTAQKLSIPCIWIDALCIVQDSENDKVREIAKMKDIYASSALTIVAASSKNVFEGFLHSRHHSETVYTIPFRIRPGLFGTMSINELHATIYDERFDPVSKRAWTMQEQILAQRTLTFATHTMIWSCKAGARNFGDSLHFPYDLDSGYNDYNEKYGLNLSSLLITEQEAKSNKDKALSCWLRLVTAYSLRSASLESDKLNAIAGIASHPSFVSSLGPSYLAGLWEYSLARQLTWYTSTWHRTLGEGERFHFHRPLTYRAPSWSWASLEGGIIHFDFQFDDEDEPEPEVMCEVIEYSTEQKFPGTNPFGEVLSAHLRLKGSVRDAWFNPRTSNVLLLPISSPNDHDIRNGVEMSYEEAWKQHVKDYMTAHPDTDLEEDPEALDGTDDNNTNGVCDESGVTETMIVSCLALTSGRESGDGVVGLLLIPYNSEGGKRYKRIGRFRRGKIEEFRNVLKREITLL